MAATKSTKGKAKAQDYKHEHDDDDDGGAKETREEEGDDGDEEEEEDDSSDDDDEPIIAAVTTRERRSNAGNRMRDLLDDEAGVEHEEMFEEDADDDEFQQLKKEEQDIFDSDFGSTSSDDDGDGDDDERGERELQREAKDASKRAKQKQRQTQQMPFLPQFAKQTKQPRRRKQPLSSSTSTPTTTTGAIASTSTSTATPGQDGRRLSSNKDLGAIQSGHWGYGQRVSSRKSVVEFKKEVQGRIDESERRRAAAPKAVKKAARTLTQADLIAEAFETEEINKASLRAFYAREHERKEREALLGRRTYVTGPKMSFVSRTQDRHPPVQVVERQPTVAEENGAVDLKGKAKAVDHVVVAPSSQPTRQQEKSVIDASSKGSLATPMEERGGASADGLPMKDGAQLATKVQASNGEAEPATGQEVALASTQGGAEQEAHLAKNSNAASARNYLCLTDFWGSKQDEMLVLFGDHDDWTAKALPARSRTLTRKVPMCAITGLPARYRDPRTMAPYANLSAYRTISELVRAEPLPPANPTAGGSRRPSKSREGSGTPAAGFSTTTPAGSGGQGTYVWHDQASVFSGRRDAGLTHSVLQRRKALPPQALASAPRKGSKAAAAVASTSASASPALAETPQQHGGMMTLSGRRKKIKLDPAFDAT